MSLTPTTVLMRMRISNRTPEFVLCAPPAQSLADWMLKSQHVTKVITSNHAGCQTIVWRSTTDQMVTLYNPHGVQMATIDIAQTACQLDLSACQPSASSDRGSEPSASVEWWCSGTCDGDQRTANDYLQRKQRRF
jgi:hypothetical protein